VVKLDISRVIAPIHLLKVLAAVAEAEAEAEAVVILLAEDPRSATR
jgi:hypothetical protein